MKPRTRQLLSSQYDAVAQLSAIDDRLSLVCIQEHDILSTIHFEQSADDGVEQLYKSLGDDLDKIEDVVDSVFVTTQFLANGLKVNQNGYWPGPNFVRPGSHKEKAS